MCRSLVLRENTTIALLIFTLFTLDIVAGLALQRIGGSLPRQTQQTSPHLKPGSSPGASRLHRHTRAESCLKSSPTEPYFHDSALNRDLARPTCCWLTSVAF